MFTQSVFIKKNTPELRNKMKELVIEYLFGSYTT